MPVEIILPKFGFTLETAEIVKWLKQDGDGVRAGDPVCEVTTDKVNMEVEAPEDGTVFGLLYPEGATVPVTEVIAYLLRPGEERPAMLPAAKAAALAATTAPVAAESAPVVAARDVAASPVAQRVAVSAHVDLSGVQGTGPNQRIMRRDVEAAMSAPAGVAGKVRATPAARHLAEQNNFDLATVAGSGPHGRVQATDVQAALAKPAPLPAAPQPTVVGADTPQIVKLEGMRRTIATRLQKSFQTAPHIFFDAQIDMTGIERLRQTLKARNEKLSVTAIVIKACALTLLRHPWLNATLDGDDIALWPSANIGMAVALDAGLIVPVIHHADALRLNEIQRQVDALAGRARNNTLQVNDMVDGTFTVSNLGMFGVDRFTAIINPPQVAILAVSRTMQQFVPDENGQPVLRSLMTITLSADHRVVDGALAANFLQDLRVILEEPALLAW
ncbi:MAG: 2-oxo acid dehydrogenase subunit E2 [Anaerolineaceae bacterium]|nr:2-oxo acid dehydrogenase subunit E2 [Anaerolineaceae bacterium]